jgi:hypothetical protein
VLTKNKFIFSSVLKAINAQKNSVRAESPKGLCSSKPEKQPTAIVKPKQKNRGAVDFCPWGRHIPRWSCGWVGVFTGAFFTTWIVRPMFLFL